MMNLLSSFRPVSILTLLLTATLLFSCKKDKDNDSPSGFPKEVNIEYRITTTTSGLNSVDVLYTNETEGQTTADDQALPYSKKFKTTVDKYEVVVISATTNAPGTIKCEILVDNKVVKTESYSGTSFVHGTLAYQF